MRLQNEDCRFQILGAGKKAKDKPEIRSLKIFLTVNSSRNCQ